MSIRTRNSEKDKLKDLDKIIKSSSSMLDDKTSNSGKRRATNPDIERSVKGLGTSKQIVDGPTRYFRIEGLAIGGWSGTKIDVIKLINKHRGITEDVLRDQYFRLNCIEIKALCHLLGNGKRNYYENVLLKKCEAVYLAQDKIKAPELDLVRMWRHYDEKGAPIEQTGIHGIVINMKLYSFITRHYSRKK